MKQLFFSFFSHILFFFFSYFKLDFKFPYAMNVIQSASGKKIRKANIYSRMHESYSTRLQTNLFITFPRLRQRSTNFVLQPLHWQGCPLMCLQTCCDSWRLQKNYSIIIMEDQMNIQMYILKEQFTPKSEKNIFFALACSAIYPFRSFGHEL